jgi:hypothetical protein
MAFFGEGFRAVFLKVWLRGHPKRNAEGLRKQRAT